jgi:hypothetical protein
VLLVIEDRLVEIEVGGKDKLEGGMPLGMLPSDTTTQGIYRNY